MIHLLSFLAGAYVCWRSCQQRIADLEFDKEKLLDFTEYQQRQIEELEVHESYLSQRVFWAEHPELKEDQTLEVGFVE
jgi:hypothetical protein